MTDKSIPGLKNVDMADHIRGYKPTAMMRSSAGVLASSMRCLVETMKLLEASRATVKEVGVVRKRCRICGKTICLETCVTDERGFPVHEACYTAKLTFENRSGESRKYRGI